ncbi:MAG: DUF1015 family protein [Candidatus Cloacimonetes bacterium]|nr:DUF1015 family protein [Candidatus Cloacimonadota bacterium]
MARIKPFKGVRPTPERAKLVAAPPYDVMNSEEAREMAKGNPYSFLHVDKPEIDLPTDIHLYDEKVYAKGRENFYKMIDEGTFIQDDSDCYYVYKLVMGNVKETGLVAGFHIEDYENDIIKKHELTRADKEADRIKHVETINANTGPIFLTYPAREDIDAIIDEIVKNVPLYDFTADDGIQHTFWKVEKDDLINTLTAKFAEVKYLYIADGHHRCASGVAVGKKKRAANPNHSGNEEYNYVMGVIFPHNQLYIMDYNRIVADLNGLTTDEFLNKVSEKFIIEKFSSDEPYKPESTHTYGMYIAGTWYKMSAKQGTFCKEDPVKSLDVAIIQDNLLEPILGIQDPRKDKRIDFVGGIRGLKELSMRVDKGEAVAISMYATSVEELMAIADAGKIMPPKSTWFEPKLRSGLINHLLD